jgi:uncharacterized membrane protein
VTGGDVAGGTPATPDKRAAEAAAVQRDVDRLSAFSDGVFAIAITLLVLSIDVPDFDRESFGDAFDTMGPEVFSYALSFIVVGIYWKAHHGMFRTLRRVTPQLLNLNLLLLGFVALIPFPTEILGNAGSTSEAVVMYAVMLAAAGYSSTGLWWYLLHHELVEPVSPDAARVTVIRAGIAPTVFACSVPVAIVSPVAAQLFWLTILPANLVVNRRYGPDEDA